jgi:hypothetical protein
MAQPGRPYPDAVAQAMLKGGREKDSAIRQLPLFATRVERDSPMDVIFYSSWEVVIDDERNLVNVSEGAAQGVIDDEATLVGSGAVRDRGAEFGHDGMTT